MRNLSSLPAIFLLLFLVGCNSSHISVQTTFLNRTDLASYHVETPDPNLAYPLIGQRLLLSWTLPNSYLKKPDLYFRLTIRFKNHTQIVKNVIPKTVAGFYIYELRDSDYEETEGILTYKAEIISDGQILETWNHRLWVELIQVGI